MRAKRSRVCSVDGCEKPHKARGLCTNHYAVLCRRGLTPRPTPVERFHASYQVDLATGCWIWTGTRDRNGYGHFQVGRSTSATGQRWLAHRYAYELLVGPIPEGLVIDHLCRNHGCVNPFGHLEPVTPAENAFRGVAPGVVAFLSNRCMSGRHDLTGDNVLRNGDHRRCRACENETRRRRYAETRQRDRKPAPVYPCGSVNGYKQHRKRGETACAACKAACAAYQKARLAKQAVA